MTPGYRYPWPASCLGADDMALLFAARETSPERTAITRLIAEAVRAQYGHLAIQPEPSTQSGEKSILRPAA